MRNTTLGTNPVSHSEVFQPSRAAACVARRTDLGTVSLVRFYELCSVPHGFVAEHRAKRAPAGIEDGLRHLRPGQGRAVHITNANQGILPDYAGARLVQEVAALSGNLPVYLPRQFLAARPLGASQLGGRLADMARVPDLLAGRNSDKGIQPEINPYLARTGWQVVGHPTYKVEIPSAGGVLAETAATNIVWDRAGHPQSVSAPEKPYGITGDL
jgi:hypothetical protein